MDQPITDPTSGSSFYVWSLTLTLTLTLSLTIVEEWMKSFKLSRAKRILATSSNLITLCSSHRYHVAIKEYAQTWVNLMSGHVWSMSIQFLCQSDHVQKTNWQIYTGQVNSENIGHYPDDSWPFLIYPDFLIYQLTWLWVAQVMSHPLISIIWSPGCSRPSLATRPSGNTCVIICHKFVILHHK